jgi:hypothetical protein
LIASAHDTSQKHDDDSTIPVDSSRSVVDISQKHDLDSTIHTDSSTRGNNYYLERIELRSEEKELFPSQDGIEAITLSMDSGIATLAKQNCASPEEQRGSPPFKIWKYGIEQATCAGIYPD